MAIVLAVLLLALLLGGLGFALHTLWWVALIVAALWTLGWLVGTQPRGRGHWWL